jgi:hypothetical protein
MPPDELTGGQTAQSATRPDDQTAATSSGTDSSTAAASSGQDTPSTTAAPAPAQGDAAKTPTQPASMAEAISQAFDAATAPTFQDPAEPLGLKTESVPASDAATPATTAADPEAKAATAKAEEGAKPEEALGADGDKEPTDLTPDELAAMSARPRQRIQQLLGERTHLRKEVAHLEPDAHSYRSLRGFMDRSDLSDENVAELMQIGADLRSGDPGRLKAFVERVMPRLQFALEATGTIVPADLKGRVDNGDMSEDAAKELAKARHEAANATARAETATRREEDGASVQAATQTQNSIKLAIANWHTQARASDPDFDLKQDLMALSAKALVAERGLPTTAAQAVAYADQALATATKQATRFRPPTAATRPSPGVHTPSPGRAGVAAVPGSLADAIGLAFDHATAPRG